jgi:integrase
LTFAHTHDSMWEYSWGREMGNLTALAVKSAMKPGRYQDGDGLMLLVKPSGSRSWLVRVQVAGQRRDFGLGSAKEVSLAEARDKARETRKRFKTGGNPSADRRAVAAKKTTFAQAAKAAHEEQKAGWKNGKHRDQWLSSLERFAFPIIGQVPIDDVDGPAIREVLSPIWMTKPETARRVRQRVGAVLDWAQSKGLRQTEAPLRALSKGLPRQPRRAGHFAAMPYPSVPQFLAELQGVTSIGGLALRFLILTAARSGEVRGALWQEVDLAKRVWNIPAARMKADREHIVPLSDAVIAILDACRNMRGGNGNLIFPGMRMKPLSDMTLLKLLQSRRPGMTVHGFRSSFRDWAAENSDLPGEVVEAALAHMVANKTEAAYRRTNFLEKRRSLMNDWMAYLSG